MSIVARRATAVNPSKPARTFAEGLVPLGTLTDCPPIPAKYVRPPVGTPTECPALPAPPAVPTRDDLIALDRRNRVFQPSADDERWLLTLLAPATVAIRYEDTVSPADLDRMFGPDLDEMLSIGACG